MLDGGVFGGVAIACSISSESIDNKILLAVCISSNISP